MRRIAIDTNIYTSFKCNDQSVVEAFRDCDFIGVDIAVIAELRHASSFEANLPLMKLCALPRSFHSKKSPLRLNLFPCEKVDPLYSLQQMCPAPSFLLQLDFCHNLA